MFYIDERATPFIQQLCQQYQVNVVIRFSYTTPYKVGNWIHLPAHYSDERLNWSFCHELSHILLEHNEHSFPSLEEENSANILANELILPHDKFRAVSKDLLVELKDHFPHCSYEVLLRRKLQFQIGVGTILDEGKITFRNAHPSLSYPLFPMVLELDIIQECYRKRAHLNKQIENFFFESVYVERNGIRRVLLWTQPLLDPFNF